jgi:hypothetical protein
MGQFLDERLSVTLDLYYNLHTDEIIIGSNIVPTEQGLPNLDLSSFMFDNVAPDTYIIGSELRVRYDLSKAAITVTTRPRT